MDVSCPRCSTLYDFDERQVLGGGVTLKCSQCDHLFRLEAPVGVLDESQRRWMVRQYGSGDILYFAGFDTLHRWIMDGRISSEDSISRTGTSWKVLKDIGEFTPVFQVVASIASISGARTEDRPSLLDVDAPRESTPATKSSYESAPPKASAPSAASMTQGGGGLRQPNRPRQATMKSTVTPRADSPKPPRQETRRLPTRQEAQTAPGLPGNRPEERDEEPTTVSNRPTTGSSPPVKLEDPRLRQSPSRNSGLDVDLDDDWSLGDLDVPDDELYSAESKRRRRRWPLMLFVFIGLFGGVLALGLWQREFLEDFVDENFRATLEEPGSAAAVTEVGEEDPFARAAGVVGEAVDEARGELRQALRPFVAESLEQAQEQISQAIDSGQRDARRAARPPSVAELVAAGRRSLDRNDARSAMQRFGQALDLEPDHAEARVGMGWATLTVGDVDLAASHFQRALRLDSSMDEALIGLGRAERERRDFRAALGAYELYLERFPRGQHASIARFQSEQLRQQLGE